MDGVTPQRVHKLCPKLVLLARSLNGADLSSINAHKSKRAGVALRVVPVLILFASAHIKA